MLLLHYFGKTFGISSNLSNICSIAGAGKLTNTFRFNWREQSWNLAILIGVIIGGTISGLYLSGGSTAAISSETMETLRSMGLTSSEGRNILPTELFGEMALTHIPSLLFLLIGGLLVGFGARYAGGCTSGHAITGLSNLQFPSLIAVIGFFIGGLLMTHFLLPILIPYATH